MQSSLRPRNRKFRKDQKGSYKFIQSRSHRLSFGSHGLKSTSKVSYLTASQCEAVRRVIIRQIRKIGHIYIRTFPLKPISKKPTKTRMGKGKGGVHQWVCPIKPGQILFEIMGGISTQVAKDILERASHKLPVSSKFI